MDDLIAALNEAIVEYDDFKEVAWEIINDFAVSNFKEELQEPLGYTRAMLTFYDRNSNSKLRSIDVAQMAHLKIHYLSRGIQSWQHVLKKKSNTPRSLTLVPSHQMALYQHVVIVVRRQTHYVLRFELNSHLVEFRNHGDIHLMVYRSSEEKSQALRNRLLGVYEPKGAFI